jgi:uncharacterized membrane protein YkvI
MDRGSDYRWGLGIRIYFYFGRLQVSAILVGIGFDIELLKDSVIAGMWGSVDQAT